MLRMVSYPRRPQSGHITCYLNRTYHVLPTKFVETLDLMDIPCQPSIANDYSCVVRAEQLASG
jgi:hypothetical protein